MSRTLTSPIALGAVLAMLAAAPDAFPKLGKVGEF